MRPGPKGEVTAAPLHLRSLPKSGSARVIAFIERYCRVVVGSKTIRAGSRMRLLAWQREVIEGMYDGERPAQALISIARKNGKTALAAALCLYHLLGDGEESPEVLIAASDERTATVCFRMVVRMVELEPRLSGLLHVHKDRIYSPTNNGRIDVLSGDANRAQGRGPNFAVLDEVHVSSPDLYDALVLGQVARRSPLMLGISTQGPAGESENLMNRLSRHGREGKDADFYFREWAAPEGCAVDDESAWAAANPALGQTVTAEALRKLCKTTREAPWRRYNLNQCVASDNAWMRPGPWDSREHAKPIRPRAEVVITLDGSYSGDCTALLATTVSATPHLEVVGLWAPSSAEPVDVLEVEATIREACRRFRVREIAADPALWTRTLQVLASEGYPVTVFPQSASRMAPATQGLYEAVVNGTVSHDGDPRLRAHVLNAIVRDDARGVRIAKPSKDSPRKIDLAVCAIMGWSRATALASKPRHGAAAF